MQTRGQGGDVNVNMGFVFRWSLSWPGMVLTLADILVNWRGCYIVAGFHIYYSWSGVVSAVGSAV